MNYKILHKIKDKLMQGRFWSIVGLGVLILLVIASPAGAIDLAHQPVIDIQVSLGNSVGELKFVPDHLAFEAGKRYKLHLTNPSGQKHYFTAKDFADGIWSQKVDAGQVEIKGAIHELEIRPNAEADWVFVPVRSGQYELHCSIPGHAEAGMKGTIVVTD
nr:cupredoxin domain-containing protein [Alkalinema sp. FACHB-956]